MSNNFLKKIWEWPLDLLFPKYCLNCQSEGDWLCEECRESLKPKAEALCPICRNLETGGQVCLKCESESHLDGLWILADYEDDLVKKIIKGIKYDFLTELSFLLDSLVLKYFGGRNWDRSYLLVPVPLHRRRYLKRGFNQAELFAQAVQRVFKNEINSAILKRIKGGRPQVGLAKNERRENVRGFFSVKKENLSAEFLSKTVVLVDDVYTTGATMQECAKVLKAAGFSRVWGLVIARG